MSTTTRAAVLWEAGKPWDIVTLELDDPAEREILVRVEAAGLCHSDDHLRTGDTRGRTPMVGGHEGAGVVEKVGPKVTRVSVGDRIITGYIPTCGICRYCTSGRSNLCDNGLNAGTGKMLDGTFRFHSGDQDLGGFCCLGTFSERLVMSEMAAIALPDDISFEIGALLGCGVPTGWGSAVKTAGVRPGDTVVIFGIGGIGINAVQGAAMAGAVRVIAVDPVEMKRERALEFGATSAFAKADEAFEFVREVTWGQLADHAIITVGVNDAEIFEQALAIVGKGGQVTVTSVGNQSLNQVQANGNLLIGYEKVIRGSMFGSCSPLDDIPRIISLYRDRKIKLDELISRRYSLDQVNDGYADMTEGRNIRGVIRFDL